MIVDLGDDAAADDRRAGVETDRAWRGRWGYPRWRCSKATDRTSTCYQVGTAATVGGADDDHRESLTMTPRSAWPCAMAWTCTSAWSSPCAAWDLPAEHHFVCPIHPDYAPLPEIHLRSGQGEGAVGGSGLSGRRGYRDRLQAGPGLGTGRRSGDGRSSGRSRPASDANINIMPSAARSGTTGTRCRWVSSQWDHRPLGFMVLSLGFRTVACRGTPRASPTRSSTTSSTRPRPRSTWRSARVVMAKIETIMQERGPIAQPIWQGVMTGSRQARQGLHAASVEIHLRRGTGHRKLRSRNPNCSGREFGGAVRGAPFGLFDAMHTFFMVGGQKLGSGALVGSHPSLRAYSDRGFTERPWWGTATTRAAG